MKTWLQGFIQAILISVTQHKKLNLIIKVLFVCFCLIAKLLEFNSFVVVFLAIKIKKYLHVSYKHLFDYLCIVKYTENENLKPWYFSQHHKRLITYFCNLKKGIYWVRNQWGKRNKLHKSSFYQTVKSFSFILKLKKHIEAKLCLFHL